MLKLTRYDKKKYPILVTSRTCFMHVIVPHKSQHVRSLSCFALYKTRSRIAEHLHHDYSKRRRKKTHQRPKYKKHPKRWNRHFSFIKCRCHFSIIVVILFLFENMMRSRQHMRIICCVRTKWICSIYPLIFLMKYFSFLRRFVFYI